MLIILEGPDCAGKSTFAQLLAEQLRRAEPNATVELLHRGPPTAHPLTEYVEPLLDYRPGRDRHVVCDRWYLGESVYPAVLGRPTLQDPAVFAYVELFLRSRGALLVRCCADADYLTDCGKHRGDARDELTRIPAVNAAFDAAVVRSALPRLDVDVTDGATDDQLDEVIGFANDEAWFAEHLSEFTTYVGRGKPTRLLLGDRRDPASTALDAWGNWPAFAPYASTSGNYLLTTLTNHDLRVPLHGTLLSTVGIANACDVDDPVALWDALGRPVTVALGRNAAAKLTRVGVPHRAVEHPQYRRRFLHSRHDEYLDALLSIDRTEATA